MNPDVSTANPLIVPANGSGSVILTIQPSFGGSYTLSGTLDTN